MILNKCLKTQFEVKTAFKPIDSSMSATRLFLAYPLQTH